MSTSTPIVWNGTTQESDQLASVIARNCTCPPEGDGPPTPVCVPHRMLLSDQRALDGLLFVRRIAERLRVEEWRTSESA